MCGIVGYITTGDELALGEKDHFMRYALALDTLRGADSTGLIAVRKDFDVYMAHTTMSGLEYVNDKHYEDFTTEPAWAMIGHNRAATRGSVKLENAHPFEFGAITMVHNGTLHNMGRNMDSFDDKLEVDSMQIALALSKVAPEDAKKVLENIDGSFALVWTDSRDDSINMARNNSRPLHYAFNYAKTAMFFMSDGHHLNTILRSMSKSQFVGKDIYSMDVQRMAKFKKGSKLDPEVIEFARYVPPKPLSTAPTWGGTLGTSGIKQVNTYQRAGGKGTGIDIATRTLETYWELKYNQRVRFTPQSYELRGNYATVYGEFLHPEWGDMGWDMTVRDVPKSLLKAALTNDWECECIGMTHPITGDMPSVLGRLVKTLHTCDPKDPEPPVEVRGPEGEWCDASALTKQLERGCIQCGGSFKQHEVEQATWVNEGRDILCKACTEEWDTAKAAV